MLIQPKTYGWRSRETGMQNLCYASTHHSLAPKPPGKGLSCLMPTPQCGWARAPESHQCRSGGAHIPHMNRKAKATGDTSSSSQQNPHELANIHVPGPCPQIFDSGGLQQSLSICIPTELPSDANALARATVRALSKGPPRWLEGKGSRGQPSQEVAPAEADFQKGNKTVLRVTQETL